MRSIHFFAPSAVSTQISGDGTHSRGARSSTPPLEPPWLTGLRQRTMPDRKGDTQLEDLPEEIMDMILIRLPSKDVGRCRAVSTSWRSATSTPKFMLEHHRRQRSLPIIDGDYGPARLVVFRDAGAGASSQQLWPFLPGAKHRSGNRLQVASDGFIIIASNTRCQLRFYICNPTIQQHALLPQPQLGKDICNSIIGLYQHHPTREYRVLWVSQDLSEDSVNFSEDSENLAEDSENLSEALLYVLTVGSYEPRHVRVRIPTVSCPSVEQKLLSGLSYRYYSPPPLPAHHHGCLHWFTYDDSNITGGARDIIVFDTEAESFRWMNSPVSPARNLSQSLYDRRLFDMKGTLAFCGGSPSSTAIDVWVMQDYEAEIWVFKYRIDVSTVEASRQLYLTSFKRKRKTPLDLTVKQFNEMAVLNERELLIRFNNRIHVLRCDIDGKFLGIANIGKSQYQMLLTHQHLQESIIPIPSHEMREEDEEPSLFTRLV
ncbi:F-box only protein 12-like isoform X1 [Aegilops tauschii subsp. strangulata]|uniref:F-box only protein 12-like isoform X1 n=1 Tax=Aegilops tauschii subsp. strangulata TaxID=200361 RepID=UPI001ABC8718